MWKRSCLEIEKFHNLVRFINEHTDLKYRYIFNKMIKLINVINFAHFIETGRNIANYRFSIFSLDEPYDLRHFSKREMRIMCELCEKFFSSSADEVKLDSYEVPQHIIDYLNDFENL